MSGPGRLGLLLAGVLAFSNSGCIFLLLEEEEDDPPPTLPPEQPINPNPPQQTNDLPPSVTDIDIADWPPLGPQGTVTITVTDDRMLSEVELFFAKSSKQFLGGSFQTFTVTGSELGEGYGDLMVRATDSNGGWAERSVTNLLVDLTPPTIQLFDTTVPATGGDARVDFWVSDAWVLGTVVLEFGNARLVHKFPEGYPSTLGEQWDSSLVSFDARVLPAQRDTATVTAIDAAGNYHSETFELYVDGDPPVVAITSPAPDAVVSGRFDIVIDASDPGGGPIWVEITAGGAPMATASGPAIVTLDAGELPAGLIDIAAWAVDEAGNESEPASVMVEVVH